MYIIVFAGSSSDCVVTAVISGVLIFILGLVGGLAGGVLAVYCYSKWQSKHHPPPSQPAPLYEEIVTSTIKDEVELQLRGQCGIWTSQITSLNANYYVRLRQK